MIARLSTLVTFALTVLSRDAHAAALNNDMSQAVGSPLEARGEMCCALAVGNRYIQTVCQYMYENCGSWSNCVKDNDNQWCRHCVINHPEDPACIKLTWPPVDPAPVGKRGLEDATILSIGKLSSSEDNTDTGHPQVHKRTIQFVQTRALVGEAQSYAKTFGLVTIRIIVSALNVVTYTIQNSGAEEIVYEILNEVTGWHINGNVGSGEVLGGHIPDGQGKGGDSFELDVN